MLVRWKGYGVMDFGWNALRLGFGSHIVSSIQSLNSVEWNIFGFTAPLLPRARAFSKPWPSNPPN
jgi:hypothetical protein